MQPHLEQVPWMSSPPLVPDYSAIDLAHLRRMTLGEPHLEREVLEMFKAQTADLLNRLKAMPADAAAMVHTLKGSARAIGAFEVGEAAQLLEGAIRAHSNAADAMQGLVSAVDDARVSIDAILNDLKP